MYVEGRLKDLIIVAGRNMYPQVSQLPRALFRDSMYVCMGIHPRGMKPVLYARQSQPGRIVPYPAKEQEHTLVRPAR